MLLKKDICSGGLQWDKPSPAPLPKAPGTCILDWPSCAGGSDHRLQSTLASVHSSANQGQFISSEDKRCGLEQLEAN